MLSFHLGHFKIPLNMRLAQKMIQLILEDCMSENAETVFRASYVTVTLPKADCLGKQS